MKLALFALASAAVLGALAWLLLIESPAEAPSPVAGGKRPAAEVIAPVPAKPSADEPSIEAVDLGPERRATADTVTGVVLAPTGERLVDAVVAIATVRDQGRDFSLQKPVQLSARTDRDGMFQVQVPGDQRFRVTASAPGFAAVRSDPMPAGELVELRLRVPALVRGSVLEEGTEAPVADVAVKLVPGHGFPALEAVTGPDGQFRIEGVVPESFRLEVLPPYHAPTTLEEPVLAAGEERALTCWVPAGKRVTGRVEDDRGKPVPGATVKSGPREVSADDLGRFAIGGLKAEQVELIASAPGFIQGSRTVDLSGTRMEAAVTLRVHRGGKVTGVVRTAAGAVVPDAEVRIYQVWGNEANPSRNGPQDLWSAQGAAAPIVRTNAQGEFELEAPPTQGWMSLCVGAIHAELGEGWSKLLKLEKLDEPARAEVIMSPRVALEGIVFNPEKEPVIGARVTISRPTEVGAIREAIVLATDAEGRFIAEGLFPGRWSLIVDAREYPRAAKHNLMLSGEAPNPVQEIVLEAGSTVRGLVVDEAGVPLGGVQVSASSRGTEDRARSDEHGEVVFELLAKGPWRVRAELDGYRPWMRDRVQEEDGLIRITMVPRAVFRGRVVHALTEAPIPQYRLHFLRTKPEGQSGWGRGQMRQEVSEPTGRFRQPLDDGTWRIVIEAPGYVPHEEKDVVIDVKTGAVGEEEVVFALHPGGEVEGYARRADGFGLGGVEIFGRMRGGPYGFVSVGRTEDDGYFRVIGLDAGRYDFAFRLGQHVLELREGVDVPGQEGNLLAITMRQETDLSLRTRAPRAWPASVPARLRPRGNRPPTMKLEIQSLDRTPIALVRDGQHPVRGATFALSETLIREQLQIPNFRTLELPDGRYRVTVHCPGLDTLSQEARVGFATPVQLEFNFDAVARALINAERAAAEQGR